MNDFPSPDSKQCESPGLVNGLLINGRYRMGEKIGQGGWGRVYSGIDLETHQQVAIKVAELGDKVPIIEAEAETHAALEGVVGVPKVFWCGRMDGFEILVMERLGPSLTNLLDLCGKPFSLKTGLLIAQQAITRIEHLHSRGFVHCDITPSNFVMGVGERQHMVYLIDFGLSVKKGEDGSTKSLCLSPPGRFASLNHHASRELCYRDDLESIAYVLLFLLRGTLPWNYLISMTFDSDEEFRDRILDGKTSPPLEVLCAGLPGELVTYFRYVRGLEFAQVPDYAYLRGLFATAFQRHAFVRDDVYDWTGEPFYCADDDLEN